MTEHCDRLMEILFSNPDREHIDVKFFVSGSLDVSREEFCSSAADMLQQMHTLEGADEAFAEEFAVLDAKTFVAG